MEQIKLYINHEFRYYEYWVTIFEGYDKDEYVPLGNRTWGVNSSVRYLKEVISKKVNGKGFYLPNLIDMKNPKIAYDGYRVYYDVKEITKEEADMITKKLEEATFDTTKEWWNEQLEKIAKCMDVYDYMKTYNECIIKLEEKSNAGEIYGEFGMIKMGDSLMEACDKFKENMHKIAIEKNEKQCIYFINGDISETKGMRIIREYVLPNGETEKVNGWDYELYGNKKL